MATFDTSAADAMLKVVTDGVLFDNVVTFSKTIDLFEANSDVVEGPQGRYVELSHMFGYNEAVGARSENGFLPVPGNPTFVNGRIRLKKTLAVAQMTESVMKNAMSGKAAFADWAEVELTKTERALRADLNRQANGYGSGILCRVNGSPTTTTFNIGGPYGLGGATQVKGWLPGLRRGMSIVAGPNSDGSALRSSGQAMTILSVSKTANSGSGSLTVDTLLPDLAASDYLFRGDALGNSAPSSGVPVEMMGLLGINDNGTIVPVFQNIDRTTYPEWQAQFIDATAAPYSNLAKDTLFMNMNDNAIELGGSDGLTHFLVTRPVFRNVHAQIRGLGGYGAVQAPSKGTTGGTKGITMWIGDREVEVRAVETQYIGYIHGLDATSLRRYHLEPFEWDSLTGSIFKQVSVGNGIKDAFYAYGRTVMELGCTNPAHNCLADVGLTGEQQA